MTAVNERDERAGSICRELLVLALLGATANIYFLANFSPSIDDELAAVRTDHSIWIAQGRFTVYLVEQLLIPQPATPFGPYVFFVATTAIGYMLLRRSHDIAESWKSYVGYWVFITYPTWFLIEEFSANVPSVGIGFVCVAAALYLSVSRRPSLSAAAAATCLLAVASGAYQSLILLFISGSVGIVLWRSLKDEGRFDHLKALRAVTYSASLLVGGVAVYLTLSGLALALVDVPPVYIDGFVNLENWRAPLWLGAAIARYAAQIYSGSSTLFGVGFPVAAATVLLAAIAVAAERQNKTLQNVGLFLFLLATPFLLNILAGPEGLPLRSLVALPYVLWMCANSTLDSRLKSVRFLGVFIVSLYSIQVLNVTSQYMGAATITQWQDRQMAYEIGRRLSELHAVAEDTGPVILDVYGFGEVQRPSVYATAATSTTRGSFFGWGRGDVNRVVGYLRLMGFDKLLPAPEHAQVRLTEEYDGMPVWPDAGSIRRVGGYYLLKLGSSPDKTRISRGVRGSATP